MFTKKIKIILSALLVAIVVGYIALYHWAKNRFTEMYQESKQQMQAEGWKIEEESPLTFSGFPFPLTANHQGFKATKQLGEQSFVLAAKNEKMHVSIINPLKYSFEGDMILSIMRQDTPVVKVNLDKGQITMSHKDQKLVPTSLTLNNLKIEALSEQSIPTLSAQVEELNYAEDEDKLTHSSDGDIRQKSGVIKVNNLDITSIKDGASTSLVHLKQIKVKSKSKLPHATVEQVKAIFADPTNSPMIQICQAGGKLPPLKASVELMEKVGSFIAIEVEAEHNAYTLNIDLDMKVNKSSPEILLTTKVNDLNRLFDAFNLDPTMRLIANGFVKKESDKSEKATISLKLSDYQLSLNEINLMKLPTLDWDNITLPADVCSKYPVANKSVVTAAPATTKAK